MLQNYLGLARAQGASDLHLSAGDAPRIRCDGKLKRLEQEMTVVTSELLLEALVETQRDCLDRYKLYDFALQMSAC